MSRNDRMILLVVPVIAALAVFWFLAIKPKQDKASKLDAEVSQLQSQVSSDQQTAQAGQKARAKFPRTYQRLVLMGKAVPVDDETASLIVQVNRIANRSGVSFRAIDVASASSASAVAIPTPTPPTTTTPTTSTSSTSTSTPTPAVPSTPAAPTEASASLLPIGATVGSAGLPVLPYSMTFRGSYFQIADFMAGIDGLVRSGKGTVSVDGRLATIDGFSLQPSTSGGLTANLAITTYVTPASQGLTAGATPAGPAPSLVQGAQSTVQSQNASSTATAAATP